MNEIRIKAAVDALKEHNKQVFISQQDICFYTNSLTEGNRFLDNKYNNLEGIQPVTLSRALTGRLSQKKEEQVLSVLEAILDEFVGMEYDELQEIYVFTGEAKQSFPNLMERESELGGGLKSFNKIPSDEIKKRVRSAKKIFIIQSLLAGWGKMEDTFKEAIERGCEEIKILLVKPYSEAAYARGRSLEHNPVYFIDDLIKSSIIKITRIVSLLEEKQKGIIQLKFYNSSPVTPLFWIERNDGMEDMYWGFYFFGETALSSPWFRLTNSRLYLVTSLKKHFKNLWKSGESFPIEGVAFNTYIENLAERAKINCFLPKKIKSEENIYFKAFYFRNFEIVSFRVIIDIANNKVAVDKTRSGVDYFGLMMTLESNSSLIAHTEFGTNPRIMNLLIYLGGARIDDKDTFYGFYTNVSHEYGIPHSNGILLKRYNPVLCPYEEVALDNKKEKKILANSVQNVANRYLVPWEENHGKRDEKEGVGDYMFYSACYFADKNEIKKAEKLLKKSVHNGFVNGVKFQKEVESGLFENINPNLIEYVREYFD